MLLGREWKARIFVLAGFFAVGLLAGACHALITGNAVNAEKYNAASLTANLRYDIVEAGRLQCVVLQDRAPMYNEPSGLHGRVIEYMSRGVKVDYIDTVSSLDKDESHAVTTVELQFQRLWGRRHVIPAGSPVLILQRDDGSGETRGRVLVDGKYYEKNFDTAYLRFPYLGQWKKVEFQGKPGYMQYAVLSESRLMGGE